MKQTHDIVSLKDLMFVMTWIFIMHIPRQLAKRYLNKTHIYLFIPQKHIKYHYLHTRLKI